MVLVDGSGHATYVERTMEEDATDPDEAQWRVNTYEFEVVQETSDCSGHKSPENLTNCLKNVNNGNKYAESRVHMSKALNSRNYGRRGAPFFAWEQWPQKLSIC